eukprot:1188076-Prorocentrum_minimum.AAC.1
MVRLVAPLTDDSDVQESQELGSVRRDAWSGTQDLSILGPVATPVYCCEADDHKDFTHTGGGLVVSGGGFFVSGGGFFVSGGGLVVSGGGLVVSGGGFFV